MVVIVVVVVVVVVVVEVVLVVVVVVLVVFLMVVVAAVLVVIAVVVEVVVVLVVVIVVVVAVVYLACFRFSYSSDDQSFPMMLCNRIKTARVLQLITPKEKFEKSNDSFTRQFCFSVCESKPFYIFAITCIIAQVG